MAGIFISHSRKNNAEAERLRDWLAEQGWGRSQVFLDLQDLKSGDRWRDVLNGMADCEAVIVCLSNEWLSSSECIREFTQAEERGKVILPVFVAQVTVSIPRFITDVQIGDTSAEGITKLRDQLFAKRITPQSFPWPPKDEANRAVYRGLQALDVQDAAIFFGRDADILRGLDDVRALRSGGPHRMLVILGASGAGKSSFLRAGLLARLKRDEENFLVLPIIRPERAAITGSQGLGASVSAATRGAVALNGAADLAQAFAAARAPIMERLRRHADAARETFAGRPPTIVIPIDQAEELFSAENKERPAFCEMLAGALAQDGNALIVATIRSDSYEPLQLEPHLAGTGQLLFNLPPIPAGSFQEIIEGPARLATPPLVVEPALTQQLLSDLDAADALPLLAFTLERLQSQHGADGKLTLADYRDRLGGLAGAIQSAVQAVLGARPNKDKLALARRLFVPALVQVDRDGLRRRVARRDDLPADTQTLADQFIAQRLLVSDDGKVEIAHEAILRQWPALAAWTAEERGALMTLDGVRAASRDWKAQAEARKNGRGESWLLHRNERLKDATKMVARSDFAGVIDEDMRAYLGACRQAERRAGASRLRMQVLAGASALTVLGVGYAYTQRDTLEPLAISWIKYKQFAHSTQELASAPPGTTFQDCREHSTDCPVMVVISEGTFLMADAPRYTGVDDQGQLQSAPDQRRRISIRRFAVSRTEITFADWNACVVAGGCDGYRPSRNGWEGDDRPVINVSWDDAKKYVDWLSRMTGHQYRLLTGVEWEYAARGVTSADDPRNGESWSFGDDESQLGDFAWFIRNSDGQTHPVATKRPNPFGLYDIHGNVWEWVEDCFDERCSRRTLRGGSSDNYPEALHSIQRLEYRPDGRSYGSGLRVARTL